MYRVQLVGAVAEMRECVDARSFAASERAVMALTRELASDITQRVLQEISDDPARRKAALRRLRERTDKRGIKMRTERNRKTPVRTLGGKVVEVVTPYASARVRGGDRQTRGTQGTGVYYVLDELGITGRSTPALRLLIARTVCEANSVSSARDLLDAAGVTVDHKAALRLAYSVCDDALRSRKEAIRVTQEGNPEGPLAGRRVVAAVDGGRINVRKRVGGRPRTGGRKRFETDWREPKVITIYVLDEHGKRDRTFPSVIDGTLNEADEVFKLLRYHLLRLGGHLAAELTLIGDGAPWIWNRAVALQQDLGIPPERFRQVLDYFHVIERLHEVSRAWSHWGDDARLAWVQTMKRFFKRGQIETVERAIRVLERKDPSLSTAREYFARNRERMRYELFRSRKLPIGSGAVESAVRRVVNLRMKGASIWWTEEHAEGILHLRAHAKSGRWQEVEDTVLGGTGWRPTARLVRAA